MRKKWHKVITLMLTVAFMTSIFATFPVTSSAAKKVFDVDTVIECEDVILGKGAETTKDKSASGGKYITSSGARVDDPATVSNPDMVVQVKIPADGTYSVYAKVIIPSGGNDSYFFKWDGDNWTDKHPNERKTWVWLNLSTQALTAGEHMFYWNHREAGAQYDCFFITTAESKLPTDLAPLDSGTTAGSTAATPAPTAAATATPAVSTSNSVSKLVKLDGGSAIIEAEDYVVGDTVTTVKVSTATGKKAVQMVTDNRIAPTGDATPGIGFKFVPDKSGSYYVWARVVCTDGGKDSCWVSTNGGDYIYGGFPMDSKDEEDFVWTKLTTVKGVKDTEASFGLLPRETGALVDRFVITNNNSYMPKGEGEMPGEVGSDVITFPDKYPKPTITPPPEHPRVLFKASDIPTIKANMENEENKAAAEKFRKYADGDYGDGNLTITAGKTNYNADILAAIEAKAFDYALYGNEENARTAIDAIKNYADTCTYEGINDYTRNMGHILFVAAEVYDWCYPILTQKDKSEIVSKCQAVATGMEIGFPPSGQGAVCGHGGESQLMRDWLSLAIATYDEYPDIYNFVAGRYFSEFVPTRNYWYTSESHHQGSAYGMYRYNADLWAQTLIYKMSGETVYIPEAGKVAYQWIYTRRGDGQHFREGDDYNEATQLVDMWKGSMTTMLGMAANFYKDPLLKKHFLRDRPGLASFDTSLGSWTPVMHLITNDPTIGKEDISSLPYTKYFDAPLGQMIARTGWDFGMNSPDTIAYMRIGELWGGNHHHKDAGNFQIYYKGILASESGYYESYGTDHDWNYNKESIAHNTLRIATSSNPSGLQRGPNGNGEPANYQVWLENGKDEYVTGEVIGHEFGPDTRVPEYSYIAGDIAKAYTDVDEAVRSMIFLPTDNEDYPAAFVVFDKVTTSEKKAEKTFVLHSLQEPTVEGNVSVIKRDEYGYNGQLTNQTLLPKNVSTEIIGGEGHEFEYDGVNHPLKANDTAVGVEKGWGRIEIKTSGDKTSYFLNVMYVGDADKNLPLEKAELIEGNGVTGTRILDRVAMFNNNKKRTKDDVSFTVPGDGDVKINVAGLKEGTWSVKANGVELDNQIASKDGGIIYFTAPAGSIEISYVNSIANKTFTASEAPYNEGIGIKLNNNYLYSDVAPTIVNDRTLLPMRAIFEALGADVEWDETTATATATGAKATIKITENDTTAYVNGIETELDVPAMIIDGRFVVPVRFISESLGATVTWDEMSSLVTIKIAVESTIKKKWDIPNVIDIKSAIQSGDDGTNTILNSFDGYLSSRWAPEGKDGDAWGIYDLGQVYALDKVFLSYYNGTSRIYYFDIQVSEDGINYVDVIKGGKSSGTTDELEEYNMKGVKARYIKYIGGGNSTNLWNSLTEIVPIEKK